MNHRKIALLLIAAMLFGLLAGCSAQSKLIGTWETQTEVSILGVSIDIPFIDNCTVSFSFEKDGTGSRTSEFGSSLPSISQAYTYSVEDGTLTLTYESGNTEEYTFTVEKDVLILDGRVDLELNKVS